MLIRLASSLILTRLLFPEVYGVMSLVWMLMYGLAMFSDVGLGPAIIRDRRGDDPDFLNTAWTVQAIRGAVLWLCSCLAAGPMALLYGQPELAQLIPAAGLTALIAGFNSTALYTCRRRMDSRRIANGASAPPASNATAVPGTTCCATGQTARAPSQTGNPAQELALPR